MKILMSCPSVKIPAKKAQSIHQMEFYRNLKDMGHEVDVLAQEGKDEVPIDIKKVFSRDIPFSRFFFNIDSKYKIKELVRENEYDIIHDRGYLFGGVATKLANRHNLPVILQIDDNWIEMEKRHANYLRMPFLLRYAKNHCRDLISRITKGFTVSSTLRKIIGKEWGADVSNIETIYNGVDPNKFRPKRKKQSLIEKYDFDGKVMVFIGNLGPWHGIENLLKSVPLLKEEFPNLSVLIVGGENRDVKRYDKWSENEVTFTGKVPYDQVPDYINLADLCVAPYPNIDYGFCPFKILEYMSCEKPVLCSDLPSLREIVTEDTGIFFKAGDHKHLAQKAKEAFNSELKTLGKRARKRVKQRFTWKKSTNKLVNLYENSIENY